MDDTSLSHRRGLWILSPLVVFFLLYVGASALWGDFYKMPVAVAFAVASAWALSLFRGVPFAEKVDIFSRGAAHRNIMVMIWIFLMAGAFAKAAVAMGAVDAAVNLTLHLMPSGMLPAGLFLAACLISLSIGTSVGTIVALMPVAVGLADKADYALPLVAGAVVGGAFFGDNLSFISDTTIAATRTQGCSMQSKFRANFIIVLPAALLALGVYVWLCRGQGSAVQAGAVEWPRVLPYLVVLLPAMAGVNVLPVLALGVLTAGGILLAQGGDAATWLGAMGAGMQGMGELIIVTLLAGGLLGLISHFGGIRYVISVLSRFMRGRRSAELGIALMVSAANFCTANNTVAILTVGDISRHVAQRFGIPPARAAGLLDTFSCLVQGMLPYGAQLLMASQLAGISVSALLPYLYYPMLVGLSALAFIAFAPRR